MMPQKTSPDSTTRSRFDLGQMAANGLKRGYTTGSCATAAVKAALLKLVCNESPTEVNVTLPDGAQYLTIPIDCIRDEDDGAVRADVIKDAGDDPDQTHRARIFARVKRNRTGEIVFLRGEGVGIVTEPGMQIGIGSPAINPVPRRMMIHAVREVLNEGDGIRDAGFDLQIGCENGRGNREAHLQSAPRDSRRHLDSWNHRNRGTEIDGGVSSIDRDLHPRGARRKSGRNRARAGQPRPAIRAQFAPPPTEACRADVKLRRLRVGMRGANLDRRTPIVSRCSG